METNKIDEALELKDEIGSCSSDTSSIEILETIDRSKSFFIDTLVQSDNANGTNSQNQSMSSFTFSDVLSHFDESVNNDDGKSSRRKSTQSCFNCDSPEHAARNCRLPRDQKRISRNRSFKNNQARGGGNTRVHEESIAVEVITPGKISFRLREALGIGRNCLPHWIYRMRRLGFINGYPPAYRKRAAENNIFKLHTEDNIKTFCENITVDPERIIKYPGFNYDDKEFNDQRNESFTIPPWNSFIESQEIYLNQLNALEKLKTDNENCSLVLKKRKIAYEDNEEAKLVLINVRKTSLEDGELCDEELSSTEIIETKRQISTINMAKTDTPKKLCSENNGSTEPVPILGTPIPMAKHISISKLDHEISRPKLENFAKGIQPFQHQAPIEKPSGFISRLHNIVKSVRKKI